MVQVLVWKEAGTLYTVKVNNNHPKIIYLHLFKHLIIFNFQWILSLIYTKSDRVANKLPYNGMVDMKLNFASAGKGPFKGGKAKNMPHRCTFLGGGGGGEGRG